MCRLLQKSVAGESEKVVLACEGGCCLVSQEEAQLEDPGLSQLSSSLNSEASDCERPAGGLRLNPPQAPTQLRAPTLSCFHATRSPAG